MNDCMPIEHVTGYGTRASKSATSTVGSAFTFQIQCHLYIGWFAQATVDINTTVRA